MTNVIQLGEHRGKPSQQRPQSEIERLIAERDECRQKAEECAREADAIDAIVRPATTDRAILRRQGMDALPFVGPVPEGRFGRHRQNYWVDEPTDDSAADNRRGRLYALMTIKLIKDSRSAVCGIYLEHIIESMIRDGIARRENGGRGSRSLTPAVRGFLFELSRHIVGLPPLDRLSS